MKRKLQHYEPINISKKQKISDYINLVSATETKNYINKDHIVDYFIEQKKILNLLTKIKILLIRKIIFLLDIYAIKVKNLKNI